MGHCSHLCGFGVGCSLQSPYPKLFEWTVLLITGIVLKCFHRVRPCESTGLLYEVCLKFALRSLVFCRLSLACLVASLATILFHIPSRIFQSICLGYFHSLDLPSKGKIILCPFCFLLRSFSLYLNGKVTPGARPQEGRL